MPTKTRFKVALLVETSKSYGRGALRGIGNYVRTHGRWSIMVDERSLSDPFPDWLSRSKVDGIIIRSTVPEVIKAARRAAKAVVHLGEIRSAGIPLVHTDDRAAAQLVARHFLERGYRHFAYAGMPDRPWSEARREEFVRVVSEAGFRTDVFEFRSPGHLGPTEPQLTSRLGAWLRSLEKPVGLMACYDVMGLRILETCHSEGIAVPEQVAVVGVDNDELLCELSGPPLSSVAHDLHGIGYRAAELLDSLMTGGLPPAAPELIPPSRVVCRRSSDIVAVDDPDVAQALHLIHEHATDGISVEEIIQKMTISHASLSRRFQKALGRSPKAEILRVQLERVQQLLVDSDLKLSAISSLAGFAHPENMMAIFKQKTGLSPTEYRKAASSSKAGSQL